jgi:8-oxo-(d)GTP phosphatase
MADNVVQAAGAVAWRQGPSAVEVLLIHRPRYDDWTLPKGKREPGEHMLINAVREVFEETGTRLTLGRRLRDPVPVPGQDQGGRLLRGLHRLRRPGRGA